MKLLYAAILFSSAIAANAADLITNGSFTAGNSGFTSSYQYVAPAAGVLSTTGVYTVGTNARTYNSSYGSFGDATTGTGNYLIANGSSTAGAVVWQQSNISFVSGTEYLFKTSFAAASNTNRADFDAFYSVDGGARQFLGNWGPERDVGVWQGMEARFVPVGQKLTIIIVNRNGSEPGNDFALDEIRLLGEAVATMPPGGGVPEPATWGMMIVGFGMIGATARRQRTSVEA